MNFGVNDTIVSTYGALLSTEALIGMVQSGLVALVVSAHPNRAGWMRVEILDGRDDLPFSYDAALDGPLYVRGTVGWEKA